MKNADQIEFWNGDIAERWVQRADDVDAMLLPFKDQLLRVAQPVAGESVLDIGCGAGALTIDAARLVGPDQGAEGVDVSKPLIALAIQRAKEASAPARFTIGDAATYESSIAFDVMMSRFGIMFFDDPGSAFAQIRKNAGKGGRLVFACWQSAEINQWANQAVQAAIPFLKEPLPQPDPEAPGPFAFADKDRVHSLMQAAGWQEIEINPWENAMTLPGGSPLNVAEFLMEIGPLSRILREQDIDADKVRDSLAELLSSHTDNQGAVSQQAAAWLVSAKNL